MFDKISICTFLITNIVKIIYIVPFYDKKDKTKCKNWAKFSHKGCYISAKIGRNHHYYTTYLGADVVFDT